MTRNELDKNEPEGAALVKRARQYATKMHGSQMYGDKPYTVHLDGVEAILVEFGHTSPILRASGQLHDVREDTHVSKEEFEHEFPGMVAVIVEAVTNEPGTNRKERAKKTYPKIAKERYAIIVKLADRISNGRVAKKKFESGDSKYFEMYKKEYPEFRAALYTSDIDILPMWWELDRLFDYQSVL